MNDLAKLSDYVRATWPNLDSSNGEHQTKVLELYKSNFTLSNMEQGRGTLENPPYWWDYDNEIGA